MTHDPHFWFGLYLGGALAVAICTTAQPPKGFNSFGIVIGVLGWPITLLMALIGKWCGLTVD